MGKAEDDYFGDPVGTPRARQIEASVFWFDRNVKDPMTVFVTDAGKVRLIEPEMRDCRECGTEFVTSMPGRGTKWTECCQSCLQDQL